MSAAAAVRTPTLYAVAVVIENPFSKRGRTTITLAKGIDRMAAEERALQCVAGEPLPLVNDAGLTTWIPHRRILSASVVEWVE